VFVKEESCPVVYWLVTLNSHKMANNHNDRGIPSDEEMADLVGNEEAGIAYLVALGIFDIPKRCGKCHCRVFYKPNKANKINCKRRKCRATCL
jgi:hypothetical protein